MGKLETNKIVLMTGVFLVIFSVGIMSNIPFAYGADYGYAALENINRPPSETECRDGQWLVLRIPQNDYICTADTTAQRWEQLGMAEIICLTKCCS